MTTRAMRALPFAAALGLAACAGGAGSVGGIGSEYLSPFYAPALVSYTAQNGKFPLVVRGNPFGGVPQAQLEQTLRQNAQLPGWAPRAQFVSDPQAEANAGLRLVVVFNRTGTPDHRAICGTAAGIPVSGPANILLVEVAFCDGPQTMSYASRRGAPPADPQSPAFRGAVNSATSAALPFVDRARQGN